MTHELTELKNAPAKEIHDFNKQIRRTIAKRFIASIVIVGAAVAAVEIVGRKFDNHEEDED